MTVREIPLSPPPELRFKRRVRFGPALAELWAARELVMTLAERDLRARYKQAVLGFAWAILTPVTLMVVFSLFFQRVAKIDTRGVPYPLFSYVGLIPWTFFSSAVSQGGLSLVANKALLNKVYCPREVFPLAGVAIAAVDMVSASAALAVLFAVYTFLPHGEAVWFPLLFLVQIAVTAGVVLFISGLLVYLRDLRHALPIMLQLGLFATPVAYGIQEIPESARLAYAALNPLAPVIDGYRRTLLYGQAPDWELLGVAMASATVLLTSGYWLFKRLEVNIADVA